MSNRPDVGDPAQERHEFEAINAFNALMFRKLKENRHKGGWSREEVSKLLKRLQKELEELEMALVERSMLGDASAALARSTEAVALECADVANFAMFIADNIGGLKYTK